MVKYYLLFTNDYSLLNDLLGYLGDEASITMGIHKAHL
ncbi:unnamed protein product, partial [marine sediment metagenome]